MKSKELDHARIQKCNLSKKSIDTSKEKYSILMECDGDEIVNAKFYKPGLLHDIIRGNMEKVKKVLMDRHKSIAGSMMKGLVGVKN